MAAKSPEGGKTMDSQKLVKPQWFWAWQDEQEEAWLRKMSQSGWHFEALQIPCFYVFQKGEPRDYVYRLDFNSDRKEFQHYLQLFQDAGWLHLTEYGSWQYFRTEARRGESPEIFTDNTSKVKKYQRVLLFLVLLMPLLSFGLVSLSRTLSSDRLSPMREGIYASVTCVYFVMFLILVFSMVKLLQRVTQLKRAKE
jgi:hypothetical protein